MAIDMLTKAYENHYDIAVLVAGDADFSDLVEAVKETGKRVYGSYVEGRVSRKLCGNIDGPIPLVDKMLTKLVA